MRIPDAVRPWLARPAVHIETLVLACAAFVMLAGNGPFWRAALAGRSWDHGATWFFSAAVFVSFTCLYIAVLALLSSRHTVRPLLALVLLVTASASYYMDRYSVYMDRPMLAAVFVTNFKEARELLGFGMAVHVLVFGLAPAALLWWPRLKRRPVGRALAVRTAWIVGAAVLAVGSLLLVFADFASLMRNKEEMRYLITPGNIVASISANLWGKAKRPDQARLVVGADARVIGPVRARPTLLVLVVGETARSQNFSLNGYNRPTNPELAKRNVISFPDAVACGTSTEVSLPCMFSPFGRSNYDEEKVQTHESVLHVLARAGVQVLWRDNQTGCKGVCDGLPTEQLDHAALAPFCNGDQCLDEVLLSGMDQVLRDRKGNLLVVMHQLGSHGPAYFRRYPPLFRRFLPDCQSEDLRVCSAAEIVNAYDNSLLYTDFFLGKVIDFLESAQRTHDTAMLYVSDHGESLGEGGLYLHGMPYAIAPRGQTRVPFVLWMSQAFSTALGIDGRCLRDRARPEAASHEQLFHSLLGVFGVQTSAYERRLDLFAPCRKS